MSITFPLVSPIPVADAGENAGSVLVCLVPGATPTYDAMAKTMTVTMTLSTPALFALATNSPLTSITYKDGVCTVSGPPAFLIPTMIAGIKFTHDYHHDVSQEKIMVVITDGTASSSQTLTFASHNSTISATIAAARQTTFTIGVPSPFPTIVLSGNDKAPVSVTIVPEVPSALHSIGTKDAFGTTVNVNAISKAGRVSNDTFSSAQGPVSSEKNVLSMCFQGPLSQVNLALSGTNFVAPQAIGSNTVLSFMIVVADEISPIMSQRITLQGAPAPAAATQKPVEALPIYGTMLTSSTPPDPVNGVPYTIQVINGTATWVPVSRVVVPVNVAMPNTPKAAVTTPFMTSIFNSADDKQPVLIAPPPAPSATASSSPKMSTGDQVLTILILIICFALFGFLGWVMFKEWKESS